MKITITTEKLLRMFSNGNYFVMDRISSVPLLQGGLLSISKTKLSLQTTNLSDFYFTEEEITPQDETGGWCFDLKQAKEFISLIRTPYVDVLFEDNSMIIQSEKTKGVFSTTTTKDFPNLPKIHEKTSIVNKDELQKAVDSVAFSASRDNTRPVLSGIYIMSEERGTTFVSTDGFRLSLFMHKNLVLNQKKPIIVSTKTISEFLKIAKGKTVEIGLDEEKSLVRIGQKGEFVITRTIEGEYPPYQKILPTKESATRIIFDREDFLNNIKTISVFVQESSGAIFFNIKREGVFMRAKNDPGKTSETFQEVEFNGVEQKIGFNYKYLLDYLTHTTSKRVIFEMDSPNSPGIFREEERENYIHIIMPIRIDE